MAADIMQMQIEPIHLAGQASDDESIDVINSTPDAESAQQHNSASAFAEDAIKQRANEQEADNGNDLVMQEALPEPQVLPSPEYESPSLVMEESRQEVMRDSSSDVAADENGAATAAAQPNGSALGSAVKDSSDDDDPLVSMRSLDKSASGLASGSADDPSQQQIAQSRLASKSGIESTSKQAVPITNSYGTAKPGEKRALEQSSGGETGNSSSSSGEEDASRAPAKRMQSASQARKKRRNVLPAIPKNQRCGTCRTCLNPQMKKACVTRREEMVKAMDKKGDLPLALLTTIGKPQKPGLPPPRKTSSATPAASEWSSDEDEEPADPWLREVEALNQRRDGGLPGPKRVPLFLKVLRGADTWEKRLVALKILEKSGGDSLDAFTHSNAGLKNLGEWVSDAKASDEASMSLAKKVLGLLRKLPIDIEALRISGIARLLKAAGKQHPELQEQAKQLVETWKKLVPADAAPPAQKRPAAGPSLNRQDSDSNKIKADPRQASTASAPPGGPKPAGADESKPVAVGAEPAPQDAAVAAASKLLLVASDFAELDTPPVIFKKAPPKEAAKKIQILGGSVSQKLAEERAASEASASASPASNAAVASASASASVIVPHTTAIGLPAQPKKTVTVSIGAPKHNFAAEPLVGVTETRLGGKRPEKTDLRSAAERAAEAASKIPDPQADPNTPRRVKRKAVSWADDSLLQSVRLFSLYEPCNKVGSGEAQAREEVLPVSEHALHAVHPAGFENAARQEHQNEAAALRNLQEEAEAEVDDTDVNPEHDWCEPPLCVLWLPSAENSERLISLLQPHGPYGCGEASQERQEREAYRHLHPYQHFGPGGREAPPCPGELPSAQQRPRPGQAPRVPWEQAPIANSEPIVTQPQPQQQPQPYLPPPPAQHQPVQAAPAPAPIPGLSAGALQQLLASMSQRGGTASSQLTQLPPPPQRASAQAVSQSQQHQQWNTPNQQAPQQGGVPHQQPPQHANIPKPTSIPAPRNINLPPPPRQQTGPGASIRQPDQSQQRPPPVTLRPPGQPSVLQPPQQRPPAALRAPGQPSQGPPAQQQLPQQRPAPPPALPRSGPPGQGGQPQYPGPPQARQQRPAQPGPVHNHHLRGPALQNPPQNIRPPSAQHPGMQQPHPQRQASHAPRPRGAPPRNPPHMQLAPPAHAPRPQQAPRGQSRALCTYFNTPRGCRKGDRCEFVHEMR